MAFEIDPATLDKIGALVMVLDPDGRILHWNAACEALSGYALDDVRGRGVWDDVMVPEADRAGVQACLDEVRAGACRNHCENFWVDRSGERHFIAWTNAAVWTREGQLECIVRTGVDRTHRKLLEEALRSSQALLSGVFSAAADAIIVLDETHHITMLNEAAERIFGYEHDELLGRSHDVLLAERNREAHRALMRAFATGPERSGSMGHPSSVVGLRKNGEEFPIDGAISKVGVERRTILTIVLRDATDRMKWESTQRFLTEAGEILSSSIDYEQTLTSIAKLSVPALADCCIIDIFGTGGMRRLKVVHADPGCSETAAQLERLPLDPGRPLVAAAVLAVGHPLRISEIAHDELSLLTQNREHLSLLRRLGVRSVMAVPLRAHGKVLGSLTFLSETPGRATEANFHLAQELARRSALAVENARLYDEAERALFGRNEMLGIVAHDLRNPLGTISVSAQTLLLKLSEQADSTLRKPIEVIVRSADRMRRLIQDLMDVARIEEGHLPLERKPESAMAVITQAWELFEPLAQQASLRLTVALPPELPAVLADRERVLQVFSNLVDNAIKFTPPGGRITMGARLVGSDVLFWVSDTGPGIAPEAQAHIFDRYWQARDRRRGAGLGLAIARGIVQAHGGRIWVDSAPDMGSTFSFSLPAAQYSSDQPGSQPGPS